MSSSVASALLTVETVYEAQLAAAASPYLTSVLIVQAASAAVSGLPSDHFAPGCVLNVQVLPSCEVSQLSAQLALELEVRVRT